MPEIARVDPFLLINGIGGILDVFGKIGNYSLRFKI
jgi:hypothetical protein